MNYVIETKNLSKKFPNKLAVDKVNIHVQKGDIYGLIGRNGAGKTTAMKMILGTIFPTEGEIVLFGSKNLDKQRYRIGSLIEAPGLYKGCTALENMKRFALLYGGTDEEIKKLLEFVGLANTGKMKAGHFSLGMKQRLGIAIALLGNPEVLVLDEPINGLDPAGIKEIRDIIHTLNKEKGVTFIISSHLLDELGKIATRYGILSDGQLVDEISAKELQERCKTCLIIETNDLAKTKDILEKEKLLGSFTTSENKLFMYDHFDDPSLINEKLVKSGLKVSSISFSGNGFEDYFIERLGK
jgi:ABC-2 type transport system ATP-binding protein